RPRRPEPKMAMSARRKEENRGAGPGPFLARRIAVLGFGSRTGPRRPRGCGPLAKSVAGRSGPLKAHFAWDKLNSQRTRGCVAPRTANEGISTRRKRTEHESTHRAGDRSAPRFQPRGPAESRRG